MAGPSFTQTYYNPPMPVTPSAIVGSMPMEPWARSVLDKRRMMVNQIPQAQYPAGYLGTLSSRRGDRVLDSLKARVNERSYQRGVHLGERIDPGDYIWPNEQDPMRGLQAVAQGVRQAPSLEYFAPTPSVDGKLAPRGAESIVTIDQHRQSQLGMLRPLYGLPARKMTPQG